MKIQRYICQENITYCNSHGNYGRFPLGYLTLCRKDLYSWTFYFVSHLFIFQFGEQNNHFTVVEIYFRIALKRKPFYYVLNIIIPAAVLAILSTLTYILPIESGEKLSMGISLLLAFTMFMLILSDNAPQTSDNSPILGKILNPKIWEENNLGLPCCVA